MAILALSWFASAAAWALMESLGLSSPVLRGVFGVNMVFHPVMFVIVWRRLLRLRVVDICCLVFAAGLCGACMALRLYAPGWGASIDLQPLYLWIPVIYVFAFTLTGHRASLRIALAIMGLFVAISLPYLVQGGQHANFTVQLHMVSAVLIAALYFFSSYQHRLQLAQLSAAELSRLANTDELTQLPNRRRMAEAIEAELVRSARYGNNFSVVLIDIDHFKSINDRYGHATGDQALVGLALRARESLRDVDQLGRWGGEEFVVLLPETPFAESMQKAAALCTHIAATPLVGNEVVTISCGVTSVAECDSAHALLRRADEALYAAKRRGRNRAEGLRTALPPPAAAPAPAVTSVTVPASDAFGVAEVDRPRLQAGRR